MEPVQLSLGNGVPEALGRCFDKLLSASERLAVDVLRSNGGGGGEGGVVRDHQSIKVRGEVAIALSCFVGGPVHLHGSRMYRAGRRLRVPRPQALSRRLSSVSAVGRSAASEPH